MTVTHTSPRQRRGERSELAPARTTNHPVLAGGLMALALMVAVNSLLGPHLLDVIDYPFSATMRNQTVALEIFSIWIIAPILVASSVGVRRGHRAGAVVALGPTAYVAYMFVQYVVGPEYTTHAPIVVLHLVVFTLASALWLTAWNAIDDELLPELTPRSKRRWAYVMTGLVGFVVLRYLPLAPDFVANAPLSDAALEDVTFFWSIVLLDLGLVVPAAVATLVRLVRGARWAPKALHAVVGWFAFVPASVATMQAVMTVAGDPYAGGWTATVIFVGGAVTFGVIAFVLFRPVVAPMATGAL